MLRDDIYKQATNKGRGLEEFPNDQVFKGPIGVVDRIWGDIVRLGLEQNVAELAHFGYTVVPPDKVAPPEFTARLLEATLKVAEKRRGFHYDLKTNAAPNFGRAAPGGYEGYLQEGDRFILFEDPVYEQALMNPTALCLLNYLLSEGYLISLFDSLFRSRSTDPLRLHTDAKMSAPYTSRATTATVTWCLTDFSPENSTTLYVPGSHRFGYRPTLNDRWHLEAAEPAHAVAGSLLVHNGHVWHGAYPRKADGYRVSLNTQFCRAWELPGEFLAYANITPAEILDRNSERFGQLVGVDLFRQFAEWQETRPNRNYAKLDADHLW